MGTLNDAGAQHRRRIASGDPTLANHDSASDAVLHYEADVKPQKLSSICVGSAGNTVVKEDMGRRVQGLGDGRDIEVKILGEARFAC